MKGDSLQYPKVVPQLPFWDVEDSSRYTDDYDVICSAGDKDRGGSKVGWVGGCVGPVRGVAGARAGLGHDESGRARQRWGHGQGGRQGGGDLPALFNL